MAIQGTVNLLIALGMFILTGFAGAVFLRAPKKALVPVLVFVALGGALMLLR